MACQMPYEGGGWRRGLRLRLGVAGWGGDAIQQSV
ncbi:hypothetical protein CCACVL1_03966 [Corchorus capsularis]|uniref:Uncharacterized protein n=1 Tax=Corchorus capsularis TaxID=210143 RepID=A0A1R3JVY4_COCAP|nr:hypothetical protein CCACVL1_03966 [Corchorus capsularis]